MSTPSTVRPSRPGPRQHKRYAQPPSPRSLDAPTAAEACRLYLREWRKVRREWRPSVAPTAATESP
jgi:hypothetical protein